MLSIQLYECKICAQIHGSENEICAQAGQAGQVLAADRHAAAGTERSTYRPTASLNDRLSTSRQLDCATSALVKCSNLNEIVVRTLTNEIPDF